MSEEKISDQLKSILEGIESRDPNQLEFLEAVKEVIASLAPVFAKEPKYLRVLPIISEPERIVQFRVPWTDDNGVMQFNRGFRVQFNQAIGPYKGGLRFHPSVNQSIVKFLGFEQIFKNALTGLSLGGGKGGSDFNPKGKSTAEVLRFCQSFMTELHKYIGETCDVPAGDIGVGGREIGFLYGQWKRLTSQSVGVLTGKGQNWGGSLIRPEATGYGVTYITEIALNDLKLNNGNGIKGLRVAISGSGNVATFAAQKCMELGAKVLTLSDSGGTAYEKQGFTKEQFDNIVAIKQRRGRIKEYKPKNGQYFDKLQPWKALPSYAINVDLILPCATQNEIDKTAAQELVSKSKVQYVVEGSNMPTTSDGISIFKKNVKFFIPAKAANAGGVAVSGLEMAQNSQRQKWTREDVDQKLKDIMLDIYNQAKTNAEKFGLKGDFQFGANAAGFVRVADAMFDQGMVL